jgi:hypothetical protein
MTTGKHFEQRALEPVARALIRRLIVPIVYFHAHWPSRTTDVDLLVIDRAGSGDVHVVEVKRTFTDVLKLLSRIRRVPAHYRWLAFQRSRQAPVMDRPELFDPESGIRVGLIEVVTMSDSSLGANIVLTAERSHEDLFELADEFTGKTRPNIKFG